MSARHFVFLAVFSLFAAFSCEKVDVVQPGLPDDGREIVLAIKEELPVRADTRSVYGSVEDGCIFTVETEDLRFEETTRVTEVTDYSLKNGGSIVWGAVAGTSPASVWSPVRVAVPSDGKVATGHFINASGGTSNTYYVCNAPQAANLSVTTSGATLSVSRSGPANGTDLVAGKATSSAANVSLELGHVFARTGTFSFTAPSGSGISVSNVSWSIKSHDSSTGIAGTYNIDNGTWSNIPSQLSATNVNSNSDFYLIPGSYDITVSCTVSMNGSSQSISRTGTVSLTKGKINNISAGFTVRRELAINPASSSISIGETQAYSASLRTWVRFGSNDVASFDSALTSGLSWSSSNTSVATVSGGVATGISAGSTNITVYYTPSGSSQLSAVAVLVVRSNDDIDPGWDPGSGINL